MRFLTSLNRFCQSLRRQPRSRRPERFVSLPRLEQLEGRVVPSTLEANFGLGGKVFEHYTASSGVDNNVTLSERTVRIGFRFFTRVVLTDTAEKINVVGTAAGGFQGSGTNTV